jgi:polar amino acid transport system substrate-binding protein
MTHPDCSPRPRALRPRERRTRYAYAAAIAVTTLAVGCSSAASSTPSNGSAASTGSAGAASIPAVHEDQAARSEVPAAIRTKGTLVVGTSADYAPLEFVGSDGHTIVGMDADLARAIGQVLGLRSQMVNGTFDALIPGLSAARYDLVMAGMNDYKSREKIVSFVDYFSAGTSFYERSSGGPAVQALASLCGDTVAVESGTSEQTDAGTQKAACAHAGKPALTVLVFNDQNAANLALASGRATVGMADSPVAGYIVKQSKGQFKLAGQSYGTVPDGIAVPKQTGMTAPVLAAVKDLMAQGIYQKILAKWGVQAGALGVPRVNGASS